MAHQGCVVLPGHFISSRGKVAGEGLPYSYGHSGGVVGAHSPCKCKYRLCGSSCVTGASTVEFPPLEVMKGHCCFHNGNPHLQGSLQSLCGRFSSVQRESQRHSQLLFLAHEMR